MKFFHYFDIVDNFFFLRFDYIYDIDSFYYCC